VAKFKCSGVLNYCFSVAIEKNEDFYNYNPLFYDSDPDAGLFVKQPNRAGTADE